MEEEVDKSVIAEDAFVRLRQYQEIKELEEEVERNHETLLKAACVIAKVFPVSTEPFDVTRLERGMGTLHNQELEILCLSNKRTAEETDDQARIRAGLLFRFWMKKVQAFVDAEDKNSHKPFEQDEIDELQRSNGDAVYRRIKKIFREVKISHETKIFTRPWCRHEDREATVADLLPSLPTAAAERKRRPAIRREI